MVNQLCIFRVTIRLLTLGVVLHSISELERPSSLVQRMQRTDEVVNSGWEQPGGLAPGPFPPPDSSFSEGRKPLATSGLYLPAWLGMTIQVRTDFGENRVA
jgi:hypothetical protein